MFATSATCSKGGGAVASSVSNYIVIGKYSDVTNRVINYRLLRSSSTIMSTLALAIMSPRSISILFGPSSY